jgi:hypothetical protein
MTGVSMVDGRKLIEGITKSSLVNLSAPNVFLGVTVPELKTQSEANSWIFATQMQIGMEIGKSQLGAWAGQKVKESNDAESIQKLESQIAERSKQLYSIGVATNVVGNWWSNSQFRAEIIAEAVAEDISKSYSNLESVTLYDVESQYSRKDPVSGIETPWKRLRRFDYFKTVPVSDVIDKLFKPNAAAEIKSAFAAATTKEGPWSVFRLFRADPKGGIFHLGPVALLITFAIGAIFWFLPKHYLNGMCRFLGWPTQDEFENHALAMPARIEGVLSDVLLYEFGVQQKDIVNISPGTPT